MAKITLDNLSNNLKEHLNGLGLTEEQVQELIDKFEDEKIGDISQLSTEEKGSLVGAINELFQDVDSGKNIIADAIDEEGITGDSTFAAMGEAIEAKNEEISELNTTLVEGKTVIADAIGEPLDSSDTFGAMSNDIDSLLSTFKTNMMNNGVTVESSDKFKALIDKIATMVEESSGKGIQYAEGVVNNKTLSSETGGNSGTITFNTSLSFTPDILFVSFQGYNSKLVACNLMSTTYTAADGSTTGVSLQYQMSEVTSDGFYFSGSGYSIFSGSKFYAIGVGEDDTTLRDSLASILTDEGVEVTDEDDMASLITKTDEEFESMSNEINELEAENTTLNNTITSKDTEISNLNSEIDELETQMESMCILDASQTGESITIASDFSFQTGISFYTSSNYVDGYADVYDDYEGGQLIESIPLTTYYNCSVQIKSRTEGIKVYLRFRFVNSDNTVSYSEVHSTSSSTSYITVNSIVHINKGCRVTMQVKTTSGYYVDIYNAKITTNLV